MVYWFTDKLINIMQDTLDTLVAMKGMLTALDAVSEQPNWSDWSDCSNCSQTTLDLLHTSLVLIQVQPWVDRAQLYTHLVDYANQHCSELVTTMVYSASPHDVVEVVVWHACRVANCDFSSIRLAHRQVYGNVTITWNP
jgi:hypothetical protein